MPNLPRRWGTLHVPKGEPHTHTTHTPAHGIAVPCYVITHARAYVIQLRRGQHCHDVDFDRSACVHVCVRACSGHAAAVDSAEIFGVSRRDNATDCTAMMYATREEAETCAGEHGKQGAHAMGDKWMVGVAHTADHDDHDDHSGHGGHGDHTTAKPTFGQSITRYIINLLYYKSKRRNIWIRDVFCYWIPAKQAPLVPGSNQNTSPHAQGCDLS